MKILSAYHRENQNLWFGKRGVSCIGFMVIVNDPVDSATKDVMFYFMFTDDGLQDEWAVACAKMIMYTELIPEAFPHVSKVRYRSDGAGCFASNLSRMLQTMWGTWTDIAEVSYRVSVSGGGKSSLDGHFAFLAAALRRGVNGGLSHWNAETTMGAAIVGGGGGMHASVCAVWTPVRPDTTPKVTLKGIEVYHHSTLVTDARGKATGLRAYYSSGFGTGQLLSIAGATTITDPCLTASTGQPFADIVDLTARITEVTKAIAAATLSRQQAQELYEWEAVHRPGHGHKERKGVEAALLKVCRKPI